MMLRKVLGTFLAAWSFLLVAHLTATSAGLIDNVVSAKMEIYCEDSLDLQVQEDYSECRNPVEAVVIDDTAGMPIVVMLFFGWIIYGAMSLGEALAGRREDDDEDDDRDIT
jgi:hypothetical protein